MAVWRSASATLAGCVDRIAVAKRRSAVQKQKGTSLSHRGKQWTRSRPTIRRSRMHIRGNAPHVECTTAWQAKCIGRHHTVCWLYSIAEAPKTFDSIVDFYLLRSLLLYIKYDYCWLLHREDSVLLIAIRENFKIINFLNFCLAFSDLLDTVKWKIYLKFPKFCLINLYKKSINICDICKFTYLSVN